MPPNTFRLRETGDVFTFRGGKPLLLQMGTQAAKQSGIDPFKFPEISIEQATKQFIPGAHPNAFFDFAQTATPQDILGGGEKIQAQTPEQVKQFNQQRLEERRSFEAIKPTRMQQSSISSQATTIDPKIQKAQQEIHKAQELQAKVNQILIKQGKQPVPIPGQAPQTPQNAQGTTQTPETTQPTSQGIQNAPQAPEPSLADEIKGIFNQLGISLPSATTQSPVTSAADVYKQFAEQTNLFGLKKDITDLVNKKTQEISDINENPFISEGLRSKKVTNIENKYQARIDALQSTFNRADEDARFLTSKYLEQVHQTQQRTDDFLFKAVDLAERELSGRRAERKFETQQALAESRFERTIAEKRREFSLRQQGAGSTVQLDQPTVDLMAQTYLTTGNIPSLGFGTAGAAQRAQIFKRAAQIAGQQGLTGQDVALNKAAFAANQQALGQLSKQKNLAESFEKTAVKNLDLALGISNKTTRAGAPILTKWVQSVQTGVFADPQVQQLQNAVQTAVNEYAKVVTGQTTGAAVSDSARRETSNLLNAAFSPRQFKAAVEVLKKEMNNRIQGFDEQTRQLQKEIKGGPTTPGASEKVQQQEQSMSDEDAYQLYLQSVGQ